MWWTRKSNINPVFPLTQNYEQYSVNTDDALSPATETPIEKIIEDLRQKKNKNPLDMTLQEQLGYVRPNETPQGESDTTESQSPTNMHAYDGDQKWRGLNHPQKQISTQPNSSTVTWS